MEKKNFYRIHSDVCKTLANPKRQEIMMNLRDKEMTVNNLVKKTGISQANLSQHLAILRNKGIVSSRREGIHVYYSLASQKIIKAFDLISEFIKDSLSNQTKTLNKVGIKRK